MARARSQRRGHPRREHTVLLPNRALKHARTYAYEDGSDCDEHPPSASELAVLRPLPQDPDREPLRAPASATNHAARGDAITRYFIHNDRPPHVHRSVWSEMASSTRKAHIRWLNRLKSVPTELHRSPLPHVAVELILRRANDNAWSWSTISSALSTLASALRDLPLYTNARDGFDLRSDTYYSAALRHAQRRAREASLNPKKSAPLSQADFITLSKRISGGAWVLLQLSWFLAGRVGDTRQLRRQHVVLGALDSATDTVAVQATFTAGKGAYFCGPYTIHSRLPSSCATAIREHLRVLNQDDPICSVADQNTLSKAVRELPDHSLRSIRKGSLTFLADCGVDDASLQLISGHRRKDTLMRYLGWGKRSSEAQTAALKRAQAVASTTATSEIRAGRHPMWAGFSSGHNGNRKGQRVATPPSLFPLQAPCAGAASSFQVLPPQNQRLGQSMQRTWVHSSNFSNALNMSPPPTYARQLDSASRGSATTRTTV
eukprot:PhM_4_TR16755/c1_g1_i1/m.26694